MHSKLRPQNGACVSFCPWLQDGCRRIWPWNTGKKQMARWIVPVTHLSTCSIRLHWQVSLMSLCVCVCVFLFVWRQIFLKTKQQTSERGGRVDLTEGCVRLALVCLEQREQWRGAELNTDQLCWLIPQTDSHKDATSLWLWGFFLFESYSDVENRKVHGNNTSPN